jgi:hypothetical protein
MKRAGGKAVQGYNAQVVANREQVIVAANVTQSHNDADQLAPMIALTGEALQAAGSEESVGLVLADGGYWNSPAISEVREQGIDVPIPTQDVGARNRASSHPSKGGKRSGSRRCCHDPKARRSIANASNSLNPSSRRPSSSGAATTSSAAASPPAKPSGG